MKALKTIRKMEPPCLVPVVHSREGCLDPAKVYMGIRRRKFPAYLLESGEGPGEKARYSVIGFDPLLYVKVDREKVKISGKLAFEGMRRTADPLSILKAAAGFGKINAPPLISSYLSSCVGYISYDYVRHLVKLDSISKDDLGQPTLEFILPEKVMVFDHIKKLTHLCHLAFFDSDPPSEGLRLAEKSLAEMGAILETEPSTTSVRPRISSVPTREEFESNVKKVKKYIRAGDIIQAVIARRIALSPAPNPEQFYMNLRRINPSPYMFFLDFPERTIIGSSPEILVKVDGRKVITRPIAGTRRRGRDIEDEKAMERELLTDEKEKAEHVMLVDLGRNDIGKISEFNSVKVIEFMKVEKYSHVQHLVSNVVGRLRKDKDAFDALRATFPAGTVTGAPKVRAMEIIEELEPVRRGIYAGAVGSFSYNGNADLAITIRTMVIEGGKGYIYAGAGIVADSIPEREHYETENKARALLAAVGV
ncbi:MAG: anthranilate synthase component I family protein [Candidatus Hadarchaeales archaeon]